MAAIAIDRALQGRAESAAARIQHPGCSPSSTMLGAAAIAVRRDATTTTVSCAKARNTRLPVGGVWFGDESQRRIYRFRAQRIKQLSRPAGGDAKADVREGAG